MIAPIKYKKVVRHSINESLTRPWLKHFFVTEVLREANAPDDIVIRDSNILEVFKSTIPLMENSFTESTMSAWRMFLDGAFRDAEVPWYSGIRKVLVQERFFSAIEQLELEMPVSNSQRGYQYYDHMRTLR